MEPLPEYRGMTSDDIIAALKTIRNQCDDLRNIELNLLAELARRIPGCSHIEMYD
jgi:hypothetical protein